MVQIEKLFSKSTHCSGGENAARLSNFVQISEGLISTSKFHSLQQLQVFLLGIIVHCCLQYSLPNPAEMVMGVSSLKLLKL